MTTAPCPLCLTNETSLVEVIHGQKLTRAWFKSYGINIDLHGEDVSYICCNRCDLKFFHPPSAGGGDLYDTLQKFDWYYTTAKPEYDIAKPLLPAEGPILEVGSGKAAFASYIGTHRYTGLEFSDAAFRRAAEAGITLLKETIEDHAAAHPAAYDGVVSFQVLEHVTDPHRFVQGCVQALKPGGTLVLAVPDHEGLCGIAQNNILDMPPHHVSHWSEQSLRMLAELYDLEVVVIERETVSSLHTAWAARAVEERKLRHRFGLGETLLDTSIVGRAISKYAGLRAADQPAPEDMAGHTVVASYRKTARRRDA
ncbi:class I SAM-dependent methyltransferase [Sphingomonas sp. MG17]|uniref:Class I SAM-dependent methyltransferase n=1 Tax=Sphingomonas tagetis TaxID=2949092 RepID=A0A9X2HNH5_9SPHN|nr:class I SAM-dependent methyltransferase [Sphingomonas tagetis]MCP3732907.1 class I SAM-dependent methyltransferase [Sphingomonas tagetis]